MARCSECTGECRRVDGDGPSPCKVLFIGEAPGQDDDYPGKLSFSGQAGREFNEHYLGLAGLSRGDVRFVNVVRCRPPLNRKVTDKEVAACSAHFLPDELAAVDPTWVVLLGAKACSLIPDIKLDIEHGIPRDGVLFGKRYRVVPMYHPAHSLYDTGMMIPLMDDFKRLKEVLAGRWSAPVDSHPHPEYKLATDLEDVFPPLGDINSVAIDTETHQGQPWSIQCCCTPGNAVMLKVDQESVTAREMISRIKGHQLTPMPYLRHRLQRRTPIFHNATADMNMLRRCGLPITGEFRDTMQEAYHLGDLPQGLKALAYRLLGIRMQTWEDVVWPHSKDAVLGWALQAMEYAEHHLSVVTRKEYVRPVKGKLFRETVKAGKIEQALRRIITHSAQSDDYPVWVKLDELHAAHGLGEIEREVGPRPLLGIANCPEKDALIYACGDADITLRVARKLDEIREQRMGSWLSRTGRMLKDQNASWAVDKEDYDV